MLKKISLYLYKFDMNLRESHNGRFMDQKVTPDNLSFISDCVINYTSGSTKKEFCIKDIWDSNYFFKNVELMYGKPSPKNKLATHEYDKFIAQPLKTLEYAQILNSTKKGKTTYYNIKNLNILEYISLKDKNAFIFLTFYLDKVLEIVGLSNILMNFLKKLRITLLQKTTLMI